MKNSILRAAVSSVLLSVVLFGAVANAYHPEEEGVFKDVDSSSENYEAIKFLKSIDVVVGYDDDTYRPEDAINRAEFLKIVMEAYNYETEDYADCFPDVTDQWFAPYICKAKELGIVDGYPSGYFMPDWEINFAEASKIVAEAFRLNADISDSETWFQQYVVSLELLSAIPTSINSFDKDLTRGEMAEIIWRIKTQKTDRASSSYEGIKEGVATTGDVVSITLYDRGDGYVKWLTDGYSDNGYKVVWSKVSGPTYPTRSTDEYKYHSDPSTHTSSLYAFDGDGTYYVRVCEYLGGECGVYSNEVQVELSENSESSDSSTSGEVNSITLNSDGDGVVSWTVDGYSAKGYKLVWSLTSGPTYPTRETDKYAYYSSPDILDGEISAFDGDGTYYVRVCEYLGGECGVYSNEIEISMVSDSTAADVTAITLSDEENGDVSWVVDGVSDNGFKVVWSKTSGPTYPVRSTDEYIYVADSSADSATVYAFDGDGTYYVRVCEYLGGECGVYSNELEVVLSQ